MLQVIVRHRRDRSLIVNNRSGLNRAQISNWSQRSSRCYDL